MVIASTDRAGEVVSHRNASLNLLYIEDDRSEVTLIRRLLKKSDAACRLDHESTLAAGIARIPKSAFDLVLLDLTLPDGGDSIENLRAICELCGEATAVIVLTERGNSDSGVACLKQGAQDYFEKGSFSGTALIRAIRHSVERHKLFSRTRQNREAMSRQERLASIGTLAAGIAHEINNPVGASMLAAETALELIDVPTCRENVRESLENIIAAMDRCGQIVRNTLRYTRDQSAERSVCDINRIILQSIDLVRIAAERTQTAIRLQLDESLPQIVANELEMELVLVNLFNNAIQSRAQPVTIEVRSTCDDEYVRIAVRDNGPGMSPDVLTHAFDPFFTTKRFRGGTGLGLSIAHGIIEDHRGTIDIHTNPGEGSTILLALPIEPTHGIASPGCGGSG